MLDGDRQGGVEPDRIGLPQPEKLKAQGCIDVGPQTLSDFGCDYRGVEQGAHGLVSQIEAMLRVRPEPRRSIRQLLEALDRVSGQITQPGPWLGERQRLWPARRLHNGRKAQGDQSRTEMPTQFRAEQQDNADTACDHLTDAPAPFRFRKAQ